MSDGKMNEFWKTYYENGQLEAEGNYRENQIEGLWKFYFKNGKLKEEVDFPTSEEK